MDQLDQNLTALKEAVTTRRRRAERARVQAFQPAPVSIEATMPGPSLSTDELPRGWFARIFGG